MLAESLADTLSTSQASTPLIYKKMPTVETIEGALYVRKEDQFFLFNSKGDNEPAYPLSWKGM